MSYRASILHPSIAALTLSVGILLSGSSAIANSNDCELSLLDLSKRARLAITRLKPLTGPALAEAMIAGYGAVLPVRVTRGGLDAAIVDREAIVNAINAAIVQNTDRRSIRLTREEISAAAREAARFYFKTLPVFEPKGPATEFGGGTVSYLPRAETLRLGETVESQQRAVGELLRLRSDFASGKTQSKDGPYAKLVQELEVLIAESVNPMDWVPQIKKGASRARALWDLDLNTGASAWMDDAASLRTWMNRTGSQPSYENQALEMLRNSPLWRELPIEFRRRYWVRGNSTEPLEAPQVTSQDWNSGQVLTLYSKLRTLNPPGRPYEPRRWWELTTQVALPAFEAILKSELAQRNSDPHFSDQVDYSIQAFQDFVFLASSNGHAPGVDLAMERVRFDAAIERIAATIAGNQVLNLPKRFLANDFKRKTRSYVDATFARKESWTFDLYTRTYAPLPQVASSVRNSGEWVRILQQITAQMN